MLYSQSAKYAILALMELAARSSDSHVSVRTLAVSRAIPFPFLSNLLPPLVKAGLIEGKRGPHGGVRWRRTPSTVSMADVVRIIDGDDSLKRCLFSSDPCDGTRNCALHAVWGPLRDQILAFLEETSIQDAADRLGTLPGKLAVT